MVQLGIGRFKGMAIGALVGVVAIALALGPATSLLEASASSETSVDRASLDRGRLRVEGVTEPRAFIFIVDSHIEPIAVDTADDVGRFRVEAEGITSPSCIGDDNQVRVGIFRGPDELLFAEFVTLDPCNPE